MCKQAAVRWQAAAVSTMVWNSTYGKYSYERHLSLLGDVMFVLRHRATGCGAAAVLLLLLLLLLLCSK